jgi:hypothetical protein
MQNTGARCALAAILVSLAMLATACQQSGAAAAPREQVHVIRAADLDRLRLGQTAPQEVERLFGSPDRRDLDGSLTYFTKRRPSGGQDSVTFHFAGGALAKICTTRAS